MSRTLSAAARHVFVSTRVLPPEEWRAETTSTSPYFSDRVQFEEAIRHVAAHRDAHAPAPCVRDAYHSVSVLRAEMGTPQMLQSACHTPLFEHQRAALESAIVIDDVTGERMARSGVWVMPCGSGKTKAAVQYASAVGGRTLVSVPNVETGLQWRREFAAFGVTRVYVHGANARGGDVSKRDVFDAEVVVVTYAALSMACRHPNPHSAWELFVCVRVLEYATHLVDECHMLPAHTYDSAVGGHIRTRLRLAVTAETHRTDGRDARLSDLAGDVLFSMSTEEARANGAAALVENYVVEVPAHEAILEGCQRQRNGSSEQRILAIVNPAKLDVLTRILRDPRHRKIVVYCDKLAILEVLEQVVMAADPTRLAYVGIFEGRTSRHDRVQFLETMRASPCCVGILTLAGSSSFDVRDLDTVVEVDVGDGSLQKFVQRTGRVQRAHSDKTAARVYSIVTSGTHEVKFAERRVAAMSEGVTWMRAQKVVSDEHTSTPLGAIFPVDDDVSRAVSRIVDAHKAKSKQRDDARVPAGACRKRHAKLARALRGAKTV